MSAQPSIIRPETVADKLAALKNLRSPDFAAAVQKEPRIIELIWFLQWQSIQAGGLQKFVADFLAEFCHCIGTEVMHRIGKIDEPYTAAERQEVIASFPRYYTSPNRFGGAQDNAETILGRFYDEMLGPEIGAFERREKPDLAFINKQNAPYFTAACKQFAIVRLRAVIAEFCTKPDAVLDDTDAWFFKSLQKALLEMLDAQAGRASQEIVTTQVSTQVFDALDFAWSEKAMVEIIGDSRFGKTESVKAWCAMYPGRARLVKTPCDNADRSLLEAIAEAVGIEVTLKTTGRELKSKIDQVLRHSGLMFVFDEGAFLLPQRYSPTTAPMRLNFIRTNVLEMGSPVVIVTTPQFFGPAAKRFEQKTGYNMAQWRGRILRSLPLPAELPEEDLAAIVAHHFLELNAACAKRVVGHALSGESYLFIVLKIAKNARAVAKKNGRDKVLCRPRF